MIEGERKPEISAYSEDPSTTFNDVARKFRIELCRQVYRPCSRHTLQLDLTWSKVSGRRQNWQSDDCLSFQRQRFLRVGSVFKSQSPFPCPMANRAAPISVSMALGHASANAVKATAGGWSTASSASLTVPLHSHMSSARREGSECNFWSHWYDSAGARTYDLPVVRQTLYR